MKVDERLSRFEPVEIPSDAQLDTTLADDFLKAFTRMARAQVKTHQAVALSVDDVKKALADQQSLIEEVKEQRRAAERKNEQLVRFTLEVVDLVFNFQKAAEAARDSELIPVAQTMTRVLQGNMDKIGLSAIPAVGEVPDAIYHFVLSTTRADDAQQAGHIVEVVRQGYVLDGTVIRKADVIVAQ